MSSCQRAKPFIGLDFWFPPVVGLTPDPAAFSLRAPGSLSLARLHMRCARPRSVPGSGSHCSPKSSGVGRTRVPPSLAPHTGTQPWALSAPTTGGNGFHLSLPSGEGLPIGFPLQAGTLLIPPAPRQEGSPSATKRIGCHDMPPRGGVPVPAPDGLSGFRPPAPRFCTNLFTQHPLSARRRPPEADWCPQRYPSPSESKMPPVGIFARLARGSVDPGVAAPCRRHFPGLSAGRRSGDCSFMMLFQQVFYDCHWRVYTDKT